MKDTAKHQGLRNQLVSILEQKGITDKKVLEAIKKVPRHLFLNSSFEDYAYQDKAFPIGAGQTISQPYTVAFQSQLLEVQKEFDNSFKNVGDLRLLFEEIFQKLLLNIRELGVSNVDKALEIQSNKSKYIK